MESFIELADDVRERLAAALEAREGRPLRIFFAAGSGDVVGTYRCWREGRADPSIVAIGYSHMFYDLCAQLGARARVVSAFPEARSREHDGAFEVRFMAKPAWGSSGALYYLAQAWYAARLLIEAARFRSDLFICSTGLPFFMLAPLELLGIPVIVSLHNTFWPRGLRPRGRGARVLQWLNGWFWRHVVAGTVCVSPECRRQVVELAGRPRGPVRVQAPQYPLDFATLATRRPPAFRPFRVVFAGRVERVKGIFMLLDAAERLQARNDLDGSVEWVICGSGSAYGLLERELYDRGLDGCIQLLGQLRQERMREAIASAHVVVAPTTGQFSEGLAKVPVEGVIAGRPVILSSVVPAGEVLGEAALEFPADDVEAFADCVFRLASDPGEYRRVSEACKAASERFFDRRQSWGSQVLHCMVDALEGKR